MGGTYLARKDYPTQKDWGYDKKKRNYNFEDEDGSRREKDRRIKDSERRRSKRKRDNYYDDDED